MRGFFVVADTVLVVYFIDSLGIIESGAEMNSTRDMRVTSPPGSFEGFTAVLGEEKSRRELGPQRGAAWNRERRRNVQ